MSSVSTPLARLNPISAIGRFLPKGWPDFLLQLAIFATFDIAYEWSRSLATGQRTVAFVHARDIVRWERDLGIFHELDVQRWAAHAPGIVDKAANWTYFNCQFTVSISFLLWVYARRNDSYYFIRNVVMAADFIGVIGYISFPAAPPRMLPDLGFVDTLAQTYKSTAVATLANPYAAMPSLHTAYALLVGTSGVLLTRRLLGEGALVALPGARRVLDRGHREPLHPGRRSPAPARSLAFSLALLVPRRAAAARPAGDAGAALLSRYDPSEARAHAGGASTSIAGSRSFSSARATAMARPLVGRNRPLVDAPGRAAAALA